MKKVLRAPSPAMLVALVALVIAVGGVAFATIPDSSGTIHGCFQKQSGDLRVVESASDCRSSEQAISWNQQGPPGSPAGAVVARLRGGPVSVTEQNVTKEIALSPNTWTQGPNEFQELQIGIEAGDDLCALLVTIFLDGERLRVLGLASGTSKDQRVAPVFEPGVTRSHTLTAEVSSGNIGCVLFDGGTVESIKVDVLGFK